MRHLPLPLVVLIVCGHLLAGCGSGSGVGDDLPAPDAASLDVFTPTDSGTDASPGLDAAPDNLADTPLADTDLDAPLLPDSEFPLDTPATDDAPAPADTASGDDAAWADTQDVTSPEDLPADTPHEAVEIPEWTHRQFGTAAMDGAYQIARDAAGNLYLAGHTRMALPGNTWGGSSDLFVARYDPAGEGLWIRQYGNVYDNWANGLAVDAAGHVWAAGTTGSPMNDAPGHGNNDAVIVRLDADGTLVWTRHYGSADDDDGNAIARSAGGNLFVAGSTLGDFGAANQGERDVFLFKTDADGAQSWVRQLGTDKDDEAHGVAVDDGDGAIYVTGITAGALGGGEPDLWDDLFLLKYDAAGVWQWTQRMGTDDEENGAAVLADGTGGVFVTGHSYGSLDGQPHGGARDLILVRFDRDGNRIWTRQVGGTGPEWGNALLIDGQGRILVIGGTAGDTDGHTSHGSYDMLVVAFDGEGNKLWSLQPGTPALEWANSGVIDVTGKLVLTGEGQGPFPGCTAAGNYDVFLARMPLQTR